MQALILKMTDTVYTKGKKGSKKLTFKITVLQNSKDFTRSILL